MTRAIQLSLNALKSHSVRPPQLKALWDFLKAKFEVAIDSRKFRLKNKLALIQMTETTSFEEYFLEFWSDLAQLSTIGVIPDRDLV